MATHARVALIGAAGGRFFGRPEVRHALARLDVVCVPDGTSHAELATAAVRDGCSRLLILGSDAAPSVGFAAGVARALRAAARQPAAGCILLGAEHYGLLVGPGPLRWCTFSVGRYAYLVQHAGLARLARGAPLSSPVAAMTPSLVHRTPAPARPVLRQLPLSLLMPGSGGHEALVAALEERWQGLLKAVLAYAVFGVASAQIKATMSELCT